MVANLLNNLLHGGKSGPNVESDASSTEANHFHKLQTLFFHYSTPYFSFNSFIF